MKERNEIQLLQWLNILNDTKTIAKNMKVEETKVLSMISNMARKGKIDMPRAEKLLKGTNYIKFLKIEFGSKNSKPLQVFNEKIKSIKC